MDSITLESIKILDIIGKGSFADVYKAIDTNTNIFTAVKVISKEKFYIEQQHNSIINEISIHKKLSTYERHPNIVQLYENIEDAKNVYLVLEYCEYGALNDLIKEFKKKNTYLTEEAGKYLFSQILKGLEYMHQNNIVHNDLKPSNILVSSDLSVKICDFGFAHIIDSDNNTKTNSDSGILFGSPCYMAPELLKYQYRKNDENVNNNSFNHIKMMSNHMKRNFDEASDVWSFGIILFYMITGELPFYDLELNELFNSICQLSPIIPSHLKISDQLVDLIRMMLNKNPQERITLEQIKIHPWISEYFKDDIPDSPFNSIDLEIINNLKSSFGISKDKLLSDLRNNIRSKEYGLYMQILCNKTVINTSIYSISDFFQSFTTKKIYERTSIVPKKQERKVKTIRICSQIRPFKPLPATIG
ncbi:CAMK family protein kinase [Tritrichomonas foetus]|uniref:CAMK family protein kinase n=1 Tax=Tritrichomonas foetus TaxID=1144522 RepID=A0A1J4JSN0_9EUKA|nr:CAMK family protein kinase [Tritrichomonas foetus]|eukprot:OHT02113.1 CAMK family protein kinase [Tritrichomonas foetus]